MRGVYVWVFALLTLLTLGGCSFLGGDEPDYTHWEPALSPDGLTIAYESPVGKNLELFTRDLQTDEIRRLTDNDSPDWSPTWSPAGDRIAFVSSREDNVDLYILHLVDLSVERLTTHESADINPDWGVDGLIYFNSDRSGAWEIYTIDPTEKRLTKITASDLSP